MRTHPLFGSFNWPADLLPKAYQQFNAYAAANGFPVRVYAGEKTDATAWSQSLIKPPEPNSDGPHYIAEFNPLNEFRASRNGNFVRIYSGTAANQYYAAKKMAVYCGALEDLWKYERWMYGTPRPEECSASSGRLGKYTKIDFAAYSSVINAMLPAVANAVRTNRMLSLMCMSAMFDIPASFVADGWRLYTVNNHNGALFSSGAAGGPQSVDSMTWHPEYGLLYPAANYREPYDKDGSILESATIAFIAAATIYAGGAAAGLWETSGTAATSVGIETGFAQTAASAIPGSGAAVSTAGAGISEQTVGSAINTAETFPVTNTMSMEGVTVTELGGMSVPTTISTAGELGGVAKNLMDVNNLKDVAQAATLINGLYKVVTNKNGQTQLQLRSNTPVTYGSATQSAGLLASSSGLLTLGGLAFAAILALRG